MSDMLTDKDTQSIHQSLLPGYFARIFYQDIDTCLTLKGHTETLPILTHFGEEQNPNIHMQELKEILNDWAQWMKAKWESGLSNEEITPLFMKYTAQQLKERGVSDLGIKQYEAANPSWMSVAGLVRYWKKKLAQ